MDEQVLRPPCASTQVPPVSGPGSVEQDFPGRPPTSPCRGDGFGLSGSQTLTIEQDGRDRKDETMTDTHCTIERTTTDELPLVEQPTKGELIVEALRTNPNRSDREIGRICGVDHKTVAKARGKIVPIASPPVSPWKPAAVEKEPPFDPFGEDGEDLVVRHQPAIAIYLNPWNAVVIRQRSDDNDDPCVFICEEHLAAVISKLSEIHAEFYHAKRALGTVEVKPGRAP
jgi:hypothetical protein